MLKLYEGGFHDLHNDIDKELVMQDIKNWVNAALLLRLAIRHEPKPRHSEFSYGLAANQNPDKNWNALNFSNESQRTIPPGCEG
jgi:hypothetical protein